MSPYTLLFRYEATAIIFTFERRHAAIPYLFIEGCQRHYHVCRRLFSARVCRYEFLIFYYYAAYT